MLAAGLLLGAPPAAATPEGQAAKASKWIGSQIHDGRIHNNQFDFDDWGLTLDAYLALVATGNRPSKAERVINTVSRNAGAYVRFEGDYFAGPVAKTLLARRVAGLDATVRIGGATVNLRQQLRSMVGRSGRVSDEGASDFSSTLTQSLAVLAFARSGTAPPIVVDYLLRQRCPKGFFRESLGKGRCGAAGSDPYVDSTAFALQALVAVRADGADLPHGAARETAGWLVSVQNGDGSWSAPGTAADTNSNTTGLAAQALAAVRPTADSGAAIDAAAGFVGRLQITARRADGGPATTDIGAIARTAADLDTALEDGITRNTRDLFRRATTQAQFGLVPTPLGGLSAGG